MNIIHTNAESRTVIPTSCFLFVRKQYTHNPDKMPFGKKMKNIDFQKNTKTRTAAETIYLH